MYKKCVNDWKIRNCIFVILSIIPVVVFFLLSRFYIDVDGWFHYSRIFEIVQNISHGKFFMDVSYFTFNNQGYGVNFFYPFFVNYPVALLWLITKSPIISVLCFNVIIHVIGLNVSYYTYKKWKNNGLYSFIFSVLYVFGYSVVNVRLLNLGTYNQQIAYFFLPAAVLGIYQLIFGDADKWEKMTLFSIVAVTLTHLLSLVILVGYAGILFIVSLFYGKKYLILSRIKVWLKVIIIYLLSAAIYIVPLLEQKISNNWLKVPALNLIYAYGMISNSLPSVSLWSKLENAFSFTEILIFFFLIIVMYMIINKIWNKTLGIISIMIVGVVILQSRLIPWKYLQRLSIVDMIQSVDRFNFFFYFAISLFIAYFLQTLSFVKKQIKYSSTIKLVLVAYLFFVAQAFAQEENGILINSLDKLNRESYVATDKTIVKGLNHPNFGYFTSHAYKGYYRINGFMDYRSQNQIVRQIMPDGKVNVNEGRYKIVNKNSHRPLLNVPGNQEIETNDFIENAVYFDGKRSFKKFSQNNFKFIIKSIPSKTKKVQTPITYLKGFVVRNQNGNKLSSYRNKNGFLEFKSDGSKKVYITYQKTLLHKLSICISILTWIIFGIMYLWQEKRA